MPSMTDVQDIRKKAREVNWWGKMNIVILGTKVAIYKNRRKKKPGNHFQFIQIHSRFNTVQIFQNWHTVHGSKECADCTRKELSILVKHVESCCSLVQTLLTVQIHLQAKASETIATLVAKVTSLSQSKNRSFIQHFSDPFRKSHNLMIGKQQKKA